jgi:hypothetical protein
MTEELRRNMRHCEYKIGLKQRLAQAKAYFSLTPTISAALNLIFTSSHNLQIAHPEMFILSRF